MSDDLKKVYERGGKAAYFFDGTTPVDLFRGRKVGDKTSVMQPTLIGFGPEDEPRPPDIYLSDEAGVSPQYASGKMVREPSSKPVTQQIVADASKYTVKGCRTIKGNYRGRIQPVDATH